ncbi:MAG TPA: carbohydrate ABC transporter permease [Chloroflexota bacterium]|jgi:ABC-type glycerol-3-phosphate transport system permease component
MSAVALGQRAVAARKRAQRLRAGRVARWAALIAVGVLLALPYIWMLSTSLKANGKEFSLRPELIPDPVVWDNYAEIFRITPFLQWFWNSVVVVVLTMTGRLFTASLTGYAFARLRFPLRGPMFALCLSTLMLPGIVTLIPEFIVFRYLNWTNSNLPLWVPAWCGGGAFFIFLCRQFFRTIPYELDEAAKVDGATPWTIYARIVLPLSVPVLVSILIFSFNWVWSDFLHPLIYLNDREKQTLAVGLNSLIGMYSTSWNLLMASAFLTSIPVIVVFFVGQKYFIRGVVMSGLAGR